MTKCTFYAGLVLAMLLNARVVAETPAADFYVGVSGSDQNDGSLQSPFATLSRAQQAVRQKITAGLTGNVQVYVRGGTYELPATLQFTAQDSGTAQYSISYAAYPGEKPVLSGGRRIQGWQNTGGNFWTVQLSEVQAGQWDFRQLFVNDQRATRARTPNLGPNGEPNFGFLAADAQFTSTSQVVALQAPALNAQPWSNLADVELVSNTMWTTLRKPLQSVNTSENSVTLASPYIVPGSFLQPKTSSASYLENAIEFLDSPGEWYLNKHTGVLSYISRNGEDMAKTVIYAPKLNKLLTIEGSASQPVENLHFSGLQFEHADWSLPAQGHYGVQAGVYRIADPDTTSQSHSFNTRPMDAAIDVRFARNVSVENGAIKHVGGAGISLVEGVVGSVVQGNNVFDIGGNGINVGDYKPNEYAVGSGYVIPPELAVSDNTISNNNIHTIGRDYTGCVGVWISFADHTLVAHNLVHDVPYTGVSVGFDWGPGDTPCKDNIVSQNHIYNVMQLMADGGGIYTLGTQPGTKLLGNLINHVDRSIWAEGGLNNGIFFDESSQEIMVQGNIIYDASGGPIRFNCDPSYTALGLNHFDIDPSNPAFPAELARLAGLEPQFLWILGSEAPEPSLSVLALTGVATLLPIVRRRWRLRISTNTVLGMRT
jgi:hypothetical protein